MKTVFDYKCKFKIKSTEYKKLEVFVKQRNGY